MRITVRLMLTLVALGVAAGVARAQPPAPLGFGSMFDAPAVPLPPVVEEAPFADDTAGPPFVVPVVHVEPLDPAEAIRLGEPTAAPEPEAWPIDLATAIHLAGGESLAVALAREQFREAAARVQAAEVLWLPSLRVGLNYNKHEGVIQDVRGVAFNTSRGAFYNGFGAGAVGASSPAYPGLVANFHMADALFQPEIARQTAASRRHGIATATNDTLLDAALAYTELVARAQQLALAVETRSDAGRLAELTTAFVQSGSGTQADADRARAELQARETAIAEAQEAYDVARARLAEILRMDPTARLTPIEERIAAWEFAECDLPAAELVARGLSSRPELAEARRLTAAAAERLRREKYAPLVPSVLVGTSYGGFGAGLGGRINNYGDRFDFDAVAYWELRNLGAGDRAARCAAEAQMNQANVRHLAAMDRVAREIVEAHAQVAARRKRIASAQEAVAAAEASYRRNVDRIHGGEGLPIETLQAVQALATARREYVRAVADYNAAQFTLQRALGWPIAPPGS